MYPLDKIKVKLVKLINQALKKQLVKASDLVYPPNQEFGDLCLPCFELAKKTKASAISLAEQLVGQIKTDQVIIATKALGPYLNFTINKQWLAEETLTQIGKLKQAFGRNKTGRQKKIVIEYSNANTHKQFHVGHLRNLCYGDAVHRILSANGFRSIPVSYINDFGIHVAKTLWALENFYQDSKLPQNKGYFLGTVYARAAKKMEQDKQAKAMVGLMMKKIESRQGPEYQLWQKTRDWSIAELDQIYQELGVKFSHIFYESQFIDQGKKLVADLYKKFFLTKSEGAVIANLEKFNLGVLVFLRSDGTALYPVADLPLAKEKIKKFKPDKSIYVVDIRQSLYFKQLFKVLELLSYSNQMIHLAYEFVKLPTGMMSSRSGTVITYEDLAKLMIKRATEETRKRHQDWPDKKINMVARKLCYGAIKFELLKVGANQVIMFEINQALRFDGYTAAYLQYSYARIQSIVKRANSREYRTNSRESRIKFDNIKEASEYRLAMKLAKYPEAVIKAGENYDPSEVAKYLFDLTQEFNDYYHQLPVLKAEPAVRAARLALIMTVSEIIANGLNLLGIEIIEEM